MSVIIKFFLIFFSDHPCGPYHSGCWGDNSIAIFLLDHDENYAFIGMKWIFFDVFSPWQFSNIFKNNENRGGISLYNLSINQLFKTLVFIQIFGKSFLTISLSQTDPKQYKQNWTIPEVIALFSTEDNGWNLSSSLTKRCILDVWQGSGYASVFQQLCTGLYLRNLS